MPLLIGGATTSRVHTAVKIHPHYTRGPGGLRHRRQPRGRRRLEPALAGDRSAAYVDDDARPSTRKVARRARAQPRPTSSACRSPRRAPTRFKIDWAAYHAAEADLPRHARVRATTTSPSSCRYIDWTPFFQTWELKGRYPAILDDDEVRARPRAQLFDDAQAMLQADRRRAAGSTAEGGDRLLAGQRRRRRHRAVHRREPRASELATLLHACASSCSQARRPAECLPRRISSRRSRAAARLRRRLRRHRRHRGGARSPSASSAPTTTTRSILVKALADRLAEAFAERMHERVRKRVLGLCAGRDASTSDELIGEAYRGIRPAPGYPAQPDHTEKATLFRLLDAERSIGVELTESFAMWPGSSVSGLYLAHPESLLFRRRARSSATRSRTTPRRKGMSVGGGRALARADPQLRSGAVSGRGGGVKARHAQPCHGRVDPAIWRHRAAPFGLRSPGQAR